MGATIQPNFTRNRVDWTTVVCTECSSRVLMSYQEWNDPNNWDCKCGATLPEADFYPTEFQWEEACWTYSSVCAVLEQMGVTPDHYGSVSAQHVLNNVHRVVDPGRREVIQRIASLAHRLGVDIIWG